MGFLWFGRKKEGKSSHEELKNHVEHLSKEFSKAGDWIKHLNSRGEGHENSMNEMNLKLSTLENDVSEIREFISFFGPKLFKQRQTVVHKQTPVYAVQSSVQTAVQESFLRGLTAMERAIVWVLLNSDMKLSYEDVAALLGKDRATIRGQVNSIRQKSEGLIEEVIEKTGKKRIYVPDSRKAELLGGIKEQVKKKKAKPE
ncbi:MAG: hypothetical protein V1886_03845 [archaeon]